MIDSIVWLVICVYFEARGESQRGQAAVAHVIINRSIKKGKSVQEVILEPYQFSWANNNARPPISDYIALIKSTKSVLKACGQRLLGITLNGCDHYHATWIDPPYWAEEYKEVTTIGQHIFYRS